MPDVLVVHAHPDDEVFATAAATLAYARRGWRVRLRVFTGGEAAGGEAAVGGSPAQARSVRMAALERSCALLGIADRGFVTRPGQWLDSTATDAPTLARADPAVLAHAVRAQLDLVRPRVLLTVGPDGLTGHPDHVAVAVAVRDALRLPGPSPVHAWGGVLRAADVRATQRRASALFPGRTVGSGRVRGAPDGAVDATVDAGPAAVAARRQALDCYRAGLGTLPAASLAGAGLRAGDSLLLRLLLDHTGWRTDHYVRWWPPVPGVRVVTTATATATGPAGRS